MLQKYCVYRMADYLSAHTIIGGDRIIFWADHPTEICWCKDEIKSIGGTRFKNGQMTVRSTGVQNFFSFFTLMASLKIANKISRKTAS
jgi:hypothetical protein